MISLEESDRLSLSGPIGKQPTQYGNSHHPIGEKNGGTIPDNGERLEMREGTQNVFEQITVRNTDISFGLLQRDQN